MTTAETLVTAAPRLSICIATFNRAAFIAETLQSIVDQLVPQVELVVVDGASTDNTSERVRPFLASGRAIRYVREDRNAGVDADYDKAVGYANGEYCWLMTDDDLLEPGAVGRVLASIADGPDLVVINASVHTANMEHSLIKCNLPIEVDRSFPEVNDDFFALSANHLSFIGCVVVRRSVWLSRERRRYYGTLFIHVGVLFQSPRLSRVKLIAMPLIRIRYGNAMWTARGFEIWNFKWPALVWGFPGFSDAAKARVWHREPWRSTRKLIHARAVGSYSMVEYRRFLACMPRRQDRWRAVAIAAMPASLANLIAGAYCVFVNRTVRATAYDLARSVHSTWMSRLAARLRGL
jgi:abequosyltransferase